MNAEDSHWYDTGFGGVALKKGDLLVFAYRGTDMLEANDILTDVSIGLYNTNFTKPIANRFAANTILDVYKGGNLNLFVTRHSLGGFLAQITSYYLIENKIHEDVKASKKDDIRILLEKGDVKFNKAYTYNAAPFFYNFFALLFSSAIPLYHFQDSKYNSQIINYSIKGDILSSAVPNLGERIGADPAGFEKTLPNENSHSLAQFYTVFYR